MIDQYLENILSSNILPEMEFFNQQLYKDFNPAISGYTLCLMVPPDFSNLPRERVDSQYLDYLSKISIFNILEYTPPQISIKNSEITNSSGAIQYASEQNISTDFNCMILDNNEYSYYNFFKLWVDYIFDVLMGTIKPNSDFLDFTNPSYGALDYVANFYLLKYKPNVRDVDFVGKVFGAFPKTLPTKEFLGSRATNDVTILSVDFACSYYSEEFDKHSDLFQEVYTYLLQYT